MKKWIPILCAALLSSLPSAAQLVSHADSVAQRLAAAGFANVRAAETPEFTAVPRLLESKGPVPLEFENGYVAFEDLPEERRRLPSVVVIGSNPIQVICTWHTPLLCTGYCLR